MHIVNIIGGLGNQMFQYAFGYSISRKKRTNFKLDVSNFNSYDLRKYELDKFHIIEDIASVEECRKLKYKQENIFETIFRNLRKKPLDLSDKYYKEPYFNYDENVLYMDGDFYLDGYWQSEKYFNDFRKDLLKIFSLNNEIHDQSKEIKQRISNTESISIHVRRGDYVTNIEANQVHGLCDVDYYKDAVSLIRNKVTDPYFYIFSDDIAWAKNNLNFINNKSFVELNNNISDHEEMFLMSICKHNIIANSSFSWWGAWLNNNSNKVVVAPKHWFKDFSINTKDLMPDSWIRL